MSIAFLYASYPKWSETFLRQDLMLLLEQGLPIQPISLFGGDCPYEPGWPHALYLQDTRPATPSAPSAKTWSIQLPPSIQTRLSLLKHRALLKKLELVLRQRRITHIHAEFADLPALLGAKAALHLGITCSVGIHAFDVHHTKYTLKSLFGRARFITACNSTATQALLQKAPWLKDKLHLIHHGLDLKTWTPAPPAPSCQQPSLLFVGRLVPKKGVANLLEALAILKGQNIPLSLHIIGTGPLEQVLKTQANTQSLPVFWHGQKTREQVREALLHATALCAPSIVAPNGDQDGIPNTILEAMATQTPVIATHAGGIDEALSEENAWLSPDTSPDAIAKTIIGFLQQPHRWADKTHAARRIIEQQFDARELASQRANLFKTL